MIRNRRIVLISIIVITMISIITYNKTVNATVERN